MLTKLGKYLVKGELGSGGMGVVYLAEDPRLGRPVALKTMSPEVARNPELLKRFYREAQAAAQLRHPNIVTIYEIDEAEGIPFIAMELLDGEDLEKIIRERRDIPIARKLEIIIEVCKGLNYAHERGIVHRDIKPGNIEVLKDGQVKLVDFGIARVGGSSMTRTGDVLGTVMYMSPEQLQGLTVDARSDLFSLGIIVHEFLTFQHPFPGNDVPQIIYKIANEQPEPVTKFLPQCPPQLENIISRVLTKNREQRYQTAADLAFDLEQVADNLRRNMVEVYLQQGQRSLNEGNFTVAKVSLHKVLEIDSTHELAKELLAQVQDSLRSRQQAEKIEQLMSRAKEAFQGKQYGDALGSLEEVLRLEPEHAEAQKYKQLVTQEKERDDNIRQHLERAEKFAGDAAYQQAKAELEALLVIDTKNSAALKMMDWVTKELVQQERLHQVRQFIKDARVQLAEKDFPKALELLAKARKLDAINIEVETLTRLVQSAQEKEERQQLLTQRLAQIEEILNREQFDQALAQAEETLQKFPDDPQVLKLHARVVRRAEGQKKRQFADEQIKAARASLEKSEYSAAITILEATIQAVPDDARLVTFLKSVKETQEQAALEGQRRETIREANEQIRAQKYIAAIEILEKAKVRVGESPELKELLQFARERAAELQRDEQIHNVLSRAQSYLSDKDFPKALELLAKARKLDANNIEVEALARLIQSAQEKEERQQLLTQRLAQIEEILNREQFDQALAQAEETLQKFPDDPQVLKLHARVVRRAEGQKKRQFADEQIKAARASLEKSEYSAAITILEATIQAVPDDARLVT
ncbi:MAG: protein kinase domain-containing protein, partial [Candidatus Acidiferrales bacterium]